MSIEEELFYQYNIDKEKLILYGFQHMKNKLTYSTSILNNRFLVVIEYDGAIKGKVMEVEYNEEYRNYRLDHLGEFSSIIKEEFINILMDIRDKCAYKQLCQYDQTKRIHQFIWEKYHIKPEFLWDKFPSYCIYRVHNKWFCLFGSVPRNKVDKNSSSKEEVEILNVKVNRNEIENLLNKKGYYEAYHMNKKNWISIILDDSLRDSEIQDLIDNSSKNV